MSNLDLSVNGDLSLQDQERDLNFGQNTLAAELASYKSATGGSPPNQFPNTNFASFQAVAIGAVPRPISLVLTRSNPPAGLTEAFDTTIFVLGQPTSVSVFR